LFTGIDFNCSPVDFECLEVNITKFNADKAGILQEKKKQKTTGRG